MMDTYPNLCGSVAGSASELGVKMHNAGYDARGLDYTYIAMEADDIEEVLDTVTTLGFDGLSVADPFNRRIPAHLDHVHEDVERIGSCNTVVIDDGETTGYNTDWRGAIGALEEVAPLDVDRAEIIGAGGAARAIAYGLRQHDVEVFVSARSPDQREELVADLELAGATDMDGQGEAGAELVVNATPVADQPDSPVDFDRHTEGKWLLDVVFGEKETDIVREARHRGWQVSPGWRMLLHQALEQFELYTGADAPTQPMGEILENSLSD